MTEKPILLLNFRVRAFLVEYFFLMHLLNIQGLELIDKDMVDPK